MSATTDEMKYAKWLFLGPAFIHGWWGYCVLNSLTELHTTGLYDLYRILGHSRILVAAVLIVTSLLSIVSVYLHNTKPRCSLALLLPQQITMLISMFTAWRCISGGHFADGAAYDPNFISADQCYVFFIALVHTALIVHVYIWEGIQEQASLRFKKLARRLGAWIRDL